MGGRTFSFSPDTLSPGEKLAIESKQDTMIATLAAIAGLVTGAYDYVVYTRTNTFITGAVFKFGGAGGATVATLVIARDADNFITSITKS